MSNKIADLQKTIKKNKNGYNYKYADLAGIHAMLTDAKISYWQETVSENGKDYIFTHIVDDESGEELRSGRGSEIVEAQNLTYKQKDAIKNIFEKRRAEIMAQNMGFRPKEG